MRPPGLLTLRDITHWTGLPADHHCLAARRLLQREGIPPAVPGKGRRAALWRWEDLHILVSRIPRADWASDEVA
ncbi:hypothetical protein [Frankia sp. CeD]|uniref:hypothetical protein n=1 Tax=Frankia sp. CeD TaxID=258230 RepID=UPI0004DD4E05|nr:hypothetical protein [Frankia sp. CeD]KEZ35832.1 hypothetical protein CEDDRAFT_02828 [Frankia sp. CeD]